MSRWQEYLSKVPVWLRDLMYLLVWLVPPAMVVELAPEALLYVLYKLGDLTTSAYILAAIVWSVLVFVVWIVIGDGSSVHETNFAKYKAIWVSFVLISLALFLGSYLSYRGVVSRVVALRGTVALANSSIDELASWVTADDEQGCKEVILPTGLHKYSVCLNEDLKEVSTFREAEDPEDPKDVTRKVRYVAARVDIIEWRAKKLQQLVQELVDEERDPEKGQVAKGTTFEGTYYIANEIVNATEEISATFASLDTAAAHAKSGGQAEMETFKRELAFLITQADAAGDLINAAKTTIMAGEVNLLAPFVLITVLYTVFLLFPWALLFLFLFRKRDYLANEKARLLDSLQLDEEFLERAGQTINRKWTPDEQRKVVAQTIGNQAFRNSEYVVSLALLTAITAAIWYFFFYPHATSGLAQLISQGGSVKAFADYLASDATPITFGFIGAYFFVIQMFLRRYFAADLNPKAYINAVVRLLVVFILSLFFQLAMPLHNLASSSAVVAAFVVGIFPRAGLRWILQMANKAVQALNAPGYVDRYLLTGLDGLNTWHEARLLEEKVENVQNLATTPLADLIIYTNFSPLQVVDWVDQAVLYIHTREQWTEAFRAASIRTATDLLDNTSKNEEFNPDMASTLATAINAAQAFAAPAPEHPREVARLAAAELYKSVADVAGTAKEAHSTSETLIGDKPETLDAIVALQVKLGSVAESVKEIKDEKVREVTQAAEKLPADGGDLVKQGKDAVGEVEKSAAVLSVEADAARQAAGRLNRKQPETLTQLTEVKERIDAACAAAANLKAQVVSAVKIVQHGVAGATAQTEWTALFKALEATQEASEQVLKEAQKIRKAAAPLDKDKPETLNMVVALQTPLNALYKAASDAQAKMKDARAAVEGLQASQPLLAEARKSLDAAAESVDNLVTIATDAKDTAAPLDIDTLATMAGLSGAKESVEKVWKAAEEAKTRGQAAAGALQTASAPPQMTKEILQVMVNSIVEGPNIKELRQFWKEQGR